MECFCQLLSLNTSEDCAQSSVSTRVFQPKEQELHHTSETSVDNIYNFPYMVGRKWNVNLFLRTQEFEVRKHFHLYGPQI